MKSGKCVPVVLFIFAGMAFLAGCDGGGGGDDGYVSGSIHYGVGIYDPWCYGPGYYPPAVVVPPPIYGRPGGGYGGPRPSQPIARPSIPSGVRPSMRR